MDRENYVARFCVRWIPALNLQIEEAISRESVVARESAQNPQNTLVMTPHREFELSLEV